MKHLDKIVILLLSLFLCTSAFGQEMWTDQSATARNKAYFGSGFDWVSTGRGGNAFSIAPEYGRILHKYASVGISGRMLWNASPGEGVAFNIHPYLRLHTSFPHPLPNLYADIGFDFRRMSYDDGVTVPAYSHDFGIRPGIDIALTQKIHLFIQVTFSGYQWSHAEGKTTSTWKLFRHDIIDRLMGVYIYY